MNNLTFNNKSFLRTIVLFCFLNLIWTFLCIKTDEFTNIDKGLITGLGFLLLFSISFYFGQPLQNATTLLLLSLSFILTFLIASFIIGAAVQRAIESILIYSICNSLFTSVVLTMLLNKFYGIQFKTGTIILTFICALSSYYLMDRFDKKLYLNYNIHPRMTMFLLFQGLTIIPLTLGLTIKSNRKRI
jgi:hypothetical protein